MKSLNDFLNEEYSKRGSMEEYYDALRNAHKRSSYLDTWINAVKTLLSGETSELPRNFFRVKMGDQYGYEWIESLVDHGKLVKVKKGRKEFIMSPNSKEGSQINNDRSTKTMIDGVNKLSRRFDEFKGISYSYNEEAEEWDVSMQDWILTWQHFEKGHGEDQTDDEINDAKAALRKDLEDSSMVKHIMKEFKKAFGSARFMLWDMETGEEGRFGNDSHKGFMYKVNGKITKA